MHPQLSHLQKNVDTLPQLTNADCITFGRQNGLIAKTLPQRTNADCIGVYQAEIMATSDFASAHKCGLHPDTTVFPGVSLSFASAHKCGLHLLPITWVFLLAFFASAHKCGLHLNHQLRCDSSVVLCLSAQMRIASIDHQSHRIPHHLCLSAQMRIASP